MDYCPWQRFMLKEMQLLFIEVEDNIFSCSCKVSTIFIDLKIQEFSVFFYRLFCENLEEREFRLHILTYHAHIFAIIHKNSKRLHEILN